MFVAIGLSKKLGRIVYKRSSRFIGKADIVDTIRGTRTTRACFLVPPTGVDIFESGIGSTGFGETYQVTCRLLSPSFPTLSTTAHPKGFLYRNLDLPRIAALQNEFVCRYMT